MRMRKLQRRSGSWLEKSNHFPARGTQVRVRTSLNGRSNRRGGPREARQVLGQATRVSVDEESWKIDEHWAAITSYVAAMYFPNEG